jgi:plastocyanin
MEPERAWPRWAVPLYAWILGISLLLTVLPSVGTWLGSLKPAAASPTPVAVPAQPEISASDAKSFETKTLIVPAGRPFDLVFHNKQPDTPHNVKITDGPAQATVLFDGDVVTGPTDVTYHVPALQAGDYYFLCKVHPNMNGTVQARPETGPAPSGSGGSPGPGSSGAPPAPGSSGAAPSP